MNLTLPAWASAVVLVCTTATGLAEPPKPPLTAPVPEEQQFFKDLADLGKDLQKIQAAWMAKSMKAAETAKPEAESVLKAERERRAAQAKTASAAVSWARRILAHLGE